MSGQVVGAGADFSGRDDKNFIKPIAIIKYLCTIVILILHLYRFIGGVEHV
jgi:hypothetical protein